MAREFYPLVECQIQKALAEGQLAGLDGEGKPLPNRQAEAVADMTTAVRIMAEDKRVALALIAHLETRYNIAVEARRRFIGE